jgi:adenine deaminase
MTSKLSRAFDKLVDVSLGRLPADLMLKNCRVVNVYSEEISPDTDIAFHKDRIAFVGDASHIKASRTIDLKGMFVSPGLMDAHTHIDYLISPTEFVKQALLHGTLTVFADPIDLVSVLGYKGFNLFLKETLRLPIRVFTMVPMALPQDPKFSSANHMKYGEVVKALDNDHVLGLGEVLSWTRVLEKERDLLRIMKHALSKGKIINGHTAGAKGAKLSAYISTGIFSCHEPINYEEVMERLRLGMWVMLREGTIRRDMEAMVSEIRKKETSCSRLMMATDGIDPIDMMKIGYIDHCLRLCVNTGMHPARAVQIATLNAATYYGLDKDLGGIAPGKIADMVVFRSLEDFSIAKVFVNGKLAVDDSKIILKITSFRYPRWAVDTVKVKRKLNASDFYIRAPQSKVHDGSVNVILADLQTDVITRQDNADLAVVDGNVSPSREKDVWKIAVIDRHHRSGNIGLGFMKGFKTDIDAFAATINVCENQLVVIGMDEEQMALAANAIVEMNGGILAIQEGQVIARFRMDIAGIMSSKPFEDATKGYEELNSTLRKHGCPFSKPLNVLFFAAFVALPHLRFTDRGMVDVKKKEYVNIFP